MALTTYRPTIDKHCLTVMFASRYPDVGIYAFVSNERYEVLALADAKLGESCTLVGYPLTPYGRLRLDMKGHITAIAHGAIFFNTGCMNGFSGGPVLNSRGRVVGILQGIPNTGHYWETMAFGPDSDAIRMVLGIVLQRNPVHNTRE